ncbi:hypothetical protein BTZ20_3939 [Rhodococcus sp. MTM3W5.2]|uniref:hypothetical protein n=1 Tax=Rhodococcus sp. MTM3W5.2 TaxID=1805827 RepID=UPI000979635E|nr:hypothetical protein [Rhodococcus sp. MTM3W5.2]AQA20853.1 hypothetical protein BTZ20_3939 [Rhodococcus sp. MTM3W5.2]
MSNDRGVIAETITSILSQRPTGAALLMPGAKLSAELGFSSLEFAELSAQLEDVFGHDPYSAGQFPDTVDGIAEYYEQVSAPGASR